MTTYAYDASGNRTIQNAGGALTTYTWDYENRMTGIALPAGTSVTMTYLPNNRIVRLADAAGHLTTLTYDISGANLLRRDIGGMTPATEHYTQPSADFGGLLAQYSTATSLRQFYLSDLSENIGVLAHGNTATDYHLFQPFGPVLLTSTPPTTQPYGFGGNVGYYTDPISGMQIAWNRVYDAALGRFVNRDPSGFDGGDWENFYRYVGNNPLRWVDAMGLGFFDQDYSTCTPYPPVGSDPCDESDGDCTSGCRGACVGRWGGSFNMVLSAYDVVTDVFDPGAMCVYPNHSYCCSCGVNCQEPGSTASGNWTVTVGPSRAAIQTWLNQNPYWGNQFQLAPGRPKTNQDYSCYQQGGSHELFKLNFKNSGKPANKVISITCCPCYLNDYTVDQNTSCSIRPPH